jgi:hypothetical protein
MLSNNASIVYDKSRRIAGIIIPCRENWEAKLDMIPENSGPVSSAKTYVPKLGKMRGEPTSVVGNSSCIFDMFVNGTFAHPQVPLERIRADDDEWTLVSNGG